MIFQFPDLDTFRLSIASTQVPAAISLTEVEVAFDEEGRPSVQPKESAPPRGMQNALKRLGVKVGKEHYSPETEKLSCWPQVLPLIR